jgi:hypothetical protein
MRYGSAERVLGPSLYLTRMVTIAVPLRGISTSKRPSLTNPAAGFRERRSLFPPAEFR